MKSKPDCSAASRTAPLTPAVALLFTLAVAPQAAEIATTNPPVALTSAPASKQAASAGLVNDTLRRSSETFKAWDIGGELRLRYDLYENGVPGGGTRNDHFRTGVNNDDGILSYRQFLHVGYTPASWVSVYAEVREASSSGDERANRPCNDALDLHQGYLTLGNPEVFPLTAKLGRQMIVYGDQRLIGPSEWGLRRSYDAAKLCYHAEDFSLDAFTGREVVVVDGEFNEPNYHDWFSGLYATTKALKFQVTDLYLLSRNVSVTSPRDLITVGTRMKSLPGKLKGWDYTVELIGQFGSLQQGDRRIDQQAFAAHAKFGHTWKKIFSAPRLGFEYDYSTGDSDPNDSKSETLDLLFHTSHGKYGQMDLVSLRNIHDVSVSLKAQPVKKLKVATEFHLFWLANTHDYFYPESGRGRNANGYGRNPNLDSFVGSELDVKAAYAVTQWLVFEAMYGHFFIGDYIKGSLPNDHADADWFTLMTTFKF